MATARSTDWTLLIVEIGEHRRQVSAVSAHQCWGRGPCQPLVVAGAVAGADDAGAVGGGSPDSHADHTFSLSATHWAATSSAGSPSISTAGSIDDWSSLVSVNQARKLLTAGSFSATWAPAILTRTSSG